MGTFGNKEWCFENLNGPEGLEAFKVKKMAKMMAKGKTATFSTPTNTATECVAAGYKHQAWGGKKGGNGHTGELGNKRYLKLLEDDVALTQSVTTATSPWVMMGTFGNKEWCFENLNGPEGLEAFKVKKMAKMMAKGKTATFSAPTNTAAECVAAGYKHQAWGGKKGGNGHTGELGNKRYLKLLEDDVALTQQGVKEKEDQWSEI